MVPCGFGYGFFQSPTNRVLLGATPRERSAAASGIKTAALRIGKTAGAALAALVFTLSATYVGTPTHAAVTVSLAVAAALAAGASAARFRGPKAVAANARL